MHRLVARSAPWFLVAALSGPAIALAQDTYPPAVPPSGPVPTAPEPGLPAEPTPNKAEPTADAPSAEAQPVAAPPAEPARTTDVTGWFRIDSDQGGLQLWAGAAHPLGEGISLATDIYVSGEWAGALPSLGEFDIGPAITAGPAVITPMIGLQINFTSQRAAALVPQLYTIVDAGPVYFESWIQVYMQDMFAAEGATALDFLHTRDFLLFKASDHVAVGIEVDANFALKNKALVADKTVYWLPIGPHMKLHYGEASTLELFAGYDIAAKDQADPASTGATPSERGKLAGRFTFVQTW